MRSWLRYWYLVLFVALVYLTHGRAHKSLLLKQNPFSGAVHVDIIPYHLMENDARSEYVTYVKMPNGDVLEVALEHASTWKRKLLGSFSSRVQGYPDSARRQISQSIIEYYNVDSERWKKRASTGAGASQAQSDAPLGGRMLADYELLKLGMLRAAIVHAPDEHPHAAAFRSCQARVSLASLVITISNASQHSPSERTKAAAMGADHAKDKLAHKVLPYWLTLSPTAWMGTYASASAEHVNQSTYDVYEAWPGVGAKSAWSELVVCVVDYTRDAIKQAYAYNRDSAATRQHLVAALAGAGDLHVASYYRLDAQSPYWTVGHARTSSGRGAVASNAASAPGLLRGYVIHRSSMSLSPIRASQHVSLQHLWQSAQASQFSARTGLQLGNVTSRSGADAARVQFALDTSIIRHRSSIMRATARATDSGVQEQHVLGSDYLRHAASHYVYDQSTETITVIWSYVFSGFQVDAREAVVGIVLALLVISRAFGSDFYRRRASPGRTAAAPHLHHARRADGAAPEQFTSNNRIVMFRYHLLRFMHDTWPSRALSRAAVRGSSSSSMGLHAIALDGPAWHMRFAVDVVQYVLDFVLLLAFVGIVAWKFATLGPFSNNASTAVGLFFYVESIVAVVVGVLLRFAWVLPRAYMQHRVDETFGRWHVLWCWLLQAFVFEGLICKSARTQRQIQRNRRVPAYDSIAASALGDYAFAVVAATAFCVLFGWDRLRLFNYGAVTLTVLFSAVYVLHVALQFGLVCLVGALKPIRGHRTPLWLWLVAAALLSLAIAKIAVFHTQQLLPWVYKYTSGLYDDFTIQVLLAAAWIFVGTYSVDHSLRAIDTRPVVYVHKVTQR